MWIEWGYDAILFLQSLRSPLGDALFKGLSFLGEEEFYLLLLPLLYWAVDKRLATRFAILVLLSSYLNYLLKAFVDAPRPSPERVAVLDDPPGAAMPSGHAQNGLVGWGYLASERTDRRFRWAMAALIFAIGLSRLYLGVHFPQDLLAGWLVGGALLLLYLSLAPRLEQWLERQPIQARIAAGAGAALLLLLLFNEEADAVAAISTLFGMAVGVPLERAYVRFDPLVRGWLQLVGRLLLGAVILLLLWRGLKPLLDPFGAPGDFTRYALTGLWVVLGAPWVFVTSGLAGSGERLRALREAAP